MNAPEVLTSGSADYLHAASYSIDSEWHLLSNTHIQPEGARSIHKVVQALHSKPGLQKTGCIDPRALRAQNWPHAKPEYTVGLLSSGLSRLTRLAWSFDSGLVRSSVRAKASIRKSRAEAWAAMAH